MFQSYGFTQRMRYCVMRFLGMCWGSWWADLQAGLRKLSWHGCFNAPKFGDAAKWAPLIAEGQVILTAHGYVGIRAMPPKGGVPALGVDGFADALVYMVNKAGGKWKSPDAGMLAAINKEIEARKLELSKK